MKDKIPSANNMLDVENACEQLNRSLGNKLDISREEMVSIFSDPESLAMLGKPNITMNEITDIISSGRNRSGMANAVDLSSTEIIGNGVAAFWNWAKAGFGLVGPEQYEARLSVCLKCDHYADAPDKQIYKLVGKLSENNKKICTVCGCVAEKKARVITGACPAPHPEKEGLTKWEEPIGGVH